MNIPLTYTYLGHRILTDQDEDRSHCTGTFIRDFPEEIVDGKKRFSSIPLLGQHNAHLLHNPAGLLRAVPAPVKKLQSSLRASN